MSAKISVIMPIFNASKVLETAIRSVISQTYKNYELVIIDGDSKDNTKDIIAKFADVIDVFVSEKDKGYADALNKGIKRASGEYYIMLAADDYLLSDALRVFVDEIEKDTDVWCANMYCFKEGNNITKFNKAHKVSEITQGKVLAHPACIFKRESFPVYGYYDINLPVNSDRELLLRWYKKGAKFQLSSKYITLFSCGGMSTQVANNQAVNKLTDGEIVSIKYGLKPKEAHRLMKKDYLRRRIGKTIKRVFSKSHLIMFTIFWLDRQHPLRKKEIKQLGINKRFFKDCRHNNQ